jgi:hypothetical protein
MLGPLPLSGIGGGRGSGGLVDGGGRGTGGLIDGGLIDGAT